MAQKWVNGTTMGMPGHWEEVPDTPAQTAQVSGGSYGTSYGTSASPYFRDAQNTDSGNVSMTNQWEVQSKLQQALEEARWNRVMNFFGQSGLSQNLQQGAYGGQVSSLAAEPALRGYEQAKRDASNNMAGRGMSLSTANDKAYGDAYGNLSRSLSTAGTAGEVAQKQMSFNLLAELLRLGSNGGS